MKSFKFNGQERVIVLEKDTDQVLIQRDFQLDGTNMFLDTSSMTGRVDYKHRYDIHTFDGNEKEIKPDNDIYERLSKYVGETVIVEGVNNEETVFKVNYMVSKKGDSIILSVAE